MSPFPIIRNIIIGIRLSYDRLISAIGFPLLVTRVLNIESGHRSFRGTICKPDIHVWVEKYLYIGMCCIHTPTVLQNNSVLRALAYNLSPEYSRFMNSRSIPFQKWEHTVVLRQQYHQAERTRAPILHRLVPTRNLIQSPMKCRHEMLPMKR